MAIDIATRFSPDEHTVALYRFDEGQGDQAHDACGDAALTLKSRTPLWGQREGVGTTARFMRREDDANLFLGPIDNDKLHLRTCPQVWTVEAWVKFTGPQGKDQGKTYATICSTDDEGFSLPEGVRGGWTLALHTNESQRGLVPWARHIGARSRPNSGVMTGSGITPVTEGYHGECEAGCNDDGWHHVAWQFRATDQQHFLFLDGVLFWKLSRPSGRTLINDSENNCVPFTVGGLIHSQDPPFYLGGGNYEGEIHDLRMSNVLRYPIADRLTIVRSELPDGIRDDTYQTALATDAAGDKVRWQVVDGELPSGLALDEETGVIEGRPEEFAEETVVTIAATNENQRDEHAFSVRVPQGTICDKSLPVAFKELAYDYQLQTEFMAAPTTWRICEGMLPEGMSLHAETGVIGGCPKSEGLTDVVIEAVDASGQSDRRMFALKVIPANLRHIGPDEHTVVLYDWQGPNGKLIRDAMGDEELTLTWTNMQADQRLPRPGWGVYPRMVGGGEFGFTGPQHNAKLDLKTCREEWTVEAWVRPGGSMNHYGRPFDLGHICGTYDNSRRGVWELYLALDGSSDWGMAPGVHFLDAEGQQGLMDMHPWRRGAGRIGDERFAGIRDTEWHHVAWQYSYAEDLHQILLDGTLIWQMATPDEQKLVNNREHDAQFSVGSRIAGYARYGGEFNWLGWGNFYGQIGEIRISDVRRY
jgi:hypothetical protein